MNLSFINDTYLPVSESKYILLTQCQSAFEVLSFNHFLIITILLFLCLMFAFKLEDTIWSRLLRGSLLLCTITFALMTETLSQFVYINELEIEIIYIITYVICIIGLIVAGWQLDKYLKKRKENMNKRKV